MKWYSNQWPSTNSEFPNLLCCAIHHCSIRILKHLLLQYNLFPNIDVSKPYVTGYPHRSSIGFVSTPLKLACYYNQAQIVQLLLQHPNMTPDGINKQDDNLQTALYCACTHNALDVVQVLLNDERVDVNIVDKDEYTPLMAAIMFGNIEIALLLINSVDKRNHNKINLNFARNNGTTAWQIAKFQNAIHKSVDMRVVAAAIEKEIGVLGGNMNNNNFFDCNFYIIIGIVVVLIAGYAAL